jgi:hypothetical protein
MHDASSLLLGFRRCDNAAMPFSSTDKVAKTLASSTLSRRRSHVPLLSKLNQSPTIRNHYTHRRNISTFDEWLTAVTVK